MDKLWQSTKTNDTIPGSERDGGDGGGSAYMDRWGSDSACNDVPSDSKNGVAIKADLQSSFNFSQGTKNEE